MKHFQGTDAERLVQALDQEIRSRGRGSIHAVNLAAGYTEGWWQHRAESGDITVRQLLPVLDHLGLDPVGFVRRVLGAENGLELDRPRGKPPEIVTKAWKRVHSDTEDGSLGVPFLDTLDRQRYQKPEEVVRLALWAIDHVELNRLPRLLGVAGSAFWLLYHLDEAEHSIYAGIEIAQKRNDRATIGHLLRRLSYVISERGNRVEALRLSEKAAVINLRHGERDGVGRALVAQGIWLYYLDRSEEAIETLRTSLDYLGASSSRNRFAAFQVSGLAHQGLGDLRAALKNVDAAQEALPTNNDWAMGKLLWLRARISADLGQLGQASRILEEVVTIFRDLHHGEAALATCELVRFQLDQGQHEEAYKAATDMRALLQPLRHNKIISAAIGDLLRSGQAGLTLALVKSVMARIEDERQKSQVWQSLRIKSPGS